MICYKKLIEVSDYDFRNTLNNASTHQLIKELANTFKMTEYRLQMAMHIEAQTILRERMKGEKQPYDAVLELIWKNPEGLMDIYETEDAQKIMDNMNNRFHTVIDRETSIGFFTDYSIMTTCNDNS